MSVPRQNAGYYSANMFICTFASSLNLMAFSPMSDMVLRKKKVKEDISIQISL